MRFENDGRKMDATLYVKDGRALVVMTWRDNGEQVGFREFATMDEALQWLSAMKWDYKVAA